MRPKSGGATVEMLPTRPAPDDSNFVPTLVWVLEQARLGKVLGYALVYTVEMEDGATRTIEAAKASEGADQHSLLGAIRRMETNYMRRTWEDDE